MDCPEREDLKVIQDHQVHPVPMEYGVHLDPLVLLDCKAKKVNKG